MSEEKLDGYRRFTEIFLNYKPKTWRHVGTPKARKQNSFEDNRTDCLLLEV
jgi:hypothetical protein